MKSFITMKSSTAALKARNALREMKIYSETVRKTSPKGCVFGIRVTDDPDKICRILALKGIHCISVESEGGRM